MIEIGDNLGIVLIILIVVAGITVRHYISNRYSNRPEDEEK